MGGTTTNDQTVGGQLGNWIQLAKWDIAAFFGSSDAAAHAAAFREVQSQATPEDQYIYQLVESENIEHTGLLGDLQSSLDKFWANLRKVISIFPWLAIGIGALVLFFFIFYYLPKKRSA
jgi:hypothetical protein